MNQFEQILALATVGTLAAVGKLLIGKKRLEWRSVAGTIIVGGALGVCASVVLVWFPALPFYVQLGIASAFSTLGYEVFKAAVEAFVFKATGKNVNNKDE